MERIILIILCLLGITLGSLKAQETDNQYYYIKTNYGTNYYAKILEHSSETLLIRNTVGDTLKLQDKFVKRIQQVGTYKIADHKLWISSNQYQHNFASPTAFGGTPGEGYAKTGYFAAYQGSVAMNEYISVGANIFPTFSVLLQGFYPVAENKLHIGLNTYMGVMPLSSASTNEFFVAPVATVSMGSREKNVTLGYGELFGQEQRAKVVYASAMFRIKSKTYLMSDNVYIALNESYLIALGFRSMWPNFSLDYGIMLLTSRNQFMSVPLPYFGMAIPIRT